MALGRLVTAAYRAVVPGAEHEISTAATSLRLWSGLSGALAVIATMFVALGLGLSRSRAAIATALMMLCPLFWITAMRPLSDVPGLLFVLTSQALALAAYNREWSRPPRRTRACPGFAGAEYRWLLAAGFAGLAAGVRVQTTLLTLPLLALLISLQIGRAGTRIVLPAVAALGAGVLLWALPLLLALGGPGEYLRLMTTTAADDLKGVEMLATQFSPTLFANALARTFIVPWGSTLLGTAVIGLTLAGAWSLATTNRRALGCALVMGIPYLTFHLLFQETASIRYALPLVPVVAMLVAATSGVGGGWYWFPAVAGLVAISATTSVTAALSYAGTDGPVARAWQDAEAEAARRTAAPTLAFHHSVGRAVRAESWRGPTVAAPVRYEWLELARHWLQGRRDPVWFLADARRTDLALVDAAAQRLMRAYEWPEPAAPLLGGIQPPRVRWYEITPPGWFLLRGWALTPETRGVSTRDGSGPASGGALGYVRRRPESALLLIGGRNLGGPCDTAASMELRIDGRSRASWSVASRSAFLQRVALPAGDLVGGGDYADLTVIARDLTGAERLVDVALEQFDVQSPGAAMVGFAGGWHMPELDASSGALWRWTEQSAALRVEAFGRDVRLSIRGESPLRDFQEPPRVTLRAGATPLAAFQPASDFTWIVDVPAAVLAAAGATVTIDTDRSFTPGARDGSGDRRQLALRITAVSAVASEQTNSRPARP